MQTQEMKIPQNIAKAQVFVLPNWEKFPGGKTVTKTK
jgi:hypothetical protein